MAPAATATATAACLLLLLLAVASAATPAPAPAVDCPTALSSLVDCLDYVSPGSKSSHPPKICCGEVKTAVSNPATVDCLCATVSSKQPPPIPINMTRVLALPAACGAPTSALSKCHGLPGGAPTEAPVPSPSGGTSPSGGATASPPKAGAATHSPVTATVLLVTVAAPLLAFYYL